MAEPMSEDSTTRIINFTDAVVAIAATLLILEPIDAAAEAGDRALPDLLASNSDQLVAFGVSFVVIGHFWLLHRRLFLSVREITQPLYWFNLLWLFSIVFLPYPTALLSERTDDPGTCALYIGTMAVTSLSALVLKILVGREKAGEGDAEYNAHLLASGAALAALCVATILALLVPWVQLWGLLLLLPAMFLGRHRTKADPVPRRQATGPAQERVDA